VGHRTGLPAERPSLDEAAARTLAQHLHGLAAPSRLLILGQLRAGPCSVNELADRVGMEQSAVSQQLRVLRHLGLVVSERHGRQVFYGLHDSHVAALLDQAIFHVEHLRLAAPEPLGIAALVA
jgi:ArsR family transcriptional regulator, nickel/cobalt-responsive transcriptional repressor